MGRPWEREGGRKSRTSSERIPTAPLLLHYSVSPLGSEMGEKRGEMYKKELYFLTEDVVCCRHQLLLLLPPFFCFGRHSSPPDFSTHTSAQRKKKRRELVFLPSICSSRVIILDNWCVSTERPRFIEGNPESNQRIRPSSQSEWVRKRETFFSAAVEKRKEKKKTTPAG